jgi:addiction module HigA family antidote
MTMFDPAHPGELIRETIEGLTTTRKTLSAIINGKQSVTPEMALKLAKAFNTSPEFWLHAQENYDLSLARKKTDIKSVRVFWKHKRSGVGTRPFGGST